MKQKWAVTVGAWMGLLVGLNAQPVDSSPASSHDPAQEEALKKTLAENPALLYWQAIALLPEIRQSDIKIINEALLSKAKAHEEQTRDLLTRTRKSLERFARAAEFAAPCVWGTTFEDGPSAPLPHLPQLQLLCRLALVKSASLFAENEPGQALQWIVRAHHAVRHLGVDPVLPSFLMQHGLEQQTLRLTALHVLSLDDALRERHRKSLRELPSLSRLPEALESERALAEWLQRMIIGLEHSPGNEKQFLESAEALLKAQAQSTSTESAQALATAAAKDTLHSLEEWKRATEQLHAMHEALISAVKKPWPQFEADLLKIRTDFADASPTLLAMLPTVTGSMRKELETQTLHDMLFIALEKGDSLAEGDLPDSKDAFLGLPMSVKKEGDDFVISARESVKGRTLALRIER